MAANWVQAYKREIRESLVRLCDDVIPFVFAYYGGNFQSDLAPFQQIAFDACVVRRENVFVTGPAGSGKTFLLERIVQALRDQDLRVVVTASTGVAAVMVHGQTLHSFAKLMKVQHQGYPDFKKDRDRAFWKNVFDNVDVIVVDEISMITPMDFQVLVNIVRDLHINVQWIFLGDFFQLPAVIKGDQTHKFCFETPEWTRTIQRHVYLHDVFRQTDQEFVRSLNRVRFGQCLSADIDLLQRRWVDDRRYRNTKPVFDFRAEYTWIFPTNAESDQHNFEVLQTLKGDTHRYRATFGYAELAKKRNRDGSPQFQRFDSKEQAPESKHYLFNESRFRKAFPVKEELLLKLGVRVVLTVNLHTKAGLVNGARGTIVAFANGTLKQMADQILPVVQFDNGVKQQICLHQWKNIVDRTRTKDVSLYTFMVQLPLRPAYATTVHYSQGQTLVNVVVSLRRLFAAGQGYVALSRAKTLEDLHLLDCPSREMFRASPVVQIFYDAICKVE